MTTQAKLMSAPKGRGERARTRAVSAMDLELVSGEVTLPFGDSGSGKPLAVIARHASVLLLFLGACSTGELTEAGQHVTYADTLMDVSGCEELGVVESSGAPPHDHAARTVAMHELRNAAATKGATHVYVDEQTSPNLARGTAYKCP